jgi:hypothetical protein
MCDVSVAWKEGHGLITEVTSSMEKGRAAGVSVARTTAICREQHLPLVKALITSTDSINSLATG